MGSIKLKYDVVVIGGGATGASIFRDLAMRGLSVCLLESKVISSGATSHSHQNLLSGMRYVIKDPFVAKECMRENKIISRIAPHIVSPIKNYFVGFKNNYTEKALNTAKKIGINFKPISIKSAFQEIPLLNRSIDIVIETEDKNINATKFCELNCISAVKKGGVLLEHTRVRNIEMKDNGEYIIFLNGKSLNHKEILTDYIVNAAGAWVNEIADKLGVVLPLLYSQGTIIIQKSLSPRGLQYLHEPGDADAYITHNGFAWIGTTSTTIESPNKAKPESWADDYLKNKFSIIIPEIINQNTIGAFVGVRSLLKSIDTLDGREQSRSFRIIEEPCRVFHMIGGKLTIARLMAEKVSDQICQRKGIKSKCNTALTLLEN